MTPHPVLAHSWGWDEVLYFVVPVLLAVAWVRRVERRARSGEESADGDDGDEGGGDGGTGDGDGGPGASPG
ncbi:MAG: hypothetical protein KKE89_01085 [Actinobacteria bacterium]|nr:hypothetical protein [Actinomycetota bacterium]